MREQIINALQQNGDLPPLPEVLAKLQKVLEDPNAEYASIAQLIELDPVLTGKIIQLANSAFYSTGVKEVRTVSEAIKKLGLEQVKKMAFSIALSRLFKDSNIIDYMRFWRHCLSVANFTQNLSHYTNASDESKDTAYIAGLMHDIGIMVFIYLIPKDYTAFIKNLANSETPLEVQEQDHFGIDHQELGSLFIQKWWVMDSEIVNAVRYHHVPFHGTKDERTCVQLVNVANGICNNQGITNGITCTHEVFKEGAWEALGLSLSQVEDMLKDVKTSIEQSMETLSHDK